MTDQTSSDDRRDDVKTERNHPQTRKGEPDARGSSQWRDDVEPPDDERRREDDEGSPTVTELAEEAEAVREEAVGSEKAHNSVGGDKAAPE